MVAFMVLSGCGSTASTGKSRSASIHRNAKGQQINAAGQRIDSLGYTCPKTGSCQAKPETLTQSERRDADLYRDQSKCDSLDRGCLIAAALKHLYAYDPTKAHRLGTVDCSQFPGDQNGFDCIATRRSGVQVEYDVETTRDHTIRVKRMP